MTEKFFKTDGHQEFLHKICQTATEKGNTYFVFDRGGTAKISECCRLTFKLDENDLNDAKTPWKMRYSAMQNVTINLPRIAFEAHQDDEKLFRLLEEKIDLVAQAHLQKKEFIGKLLDMGKYGPLALLSMNMDGEPYYRFNKASFLIGMVGLNELVQYHTGQQMHESKDATMFGLKVISVMKKHAEALGQKYGIKMPLEQTPAESTARSTDAASAMPRFSAPGRPSSRKITTGRVGRSGRARNDVAPNSPRLTANANPTASPSDRAATGQSTCASTRAGPAPSTAAASCRRRP